MVRINRMMQRYGPEAEDARSKLRIYAREKMQELFPAAGSPSHSTETTVRMMEATRDSIYCLLRLIRDSAGCAPKRLRFR